MRTIVTSIFILTILGCSHSDQISDDTTALDSSKQIADEQSNKDTLRTSGDRKYYDSAHFTIVRGKYISGAKFIDVYENKLTNLDSWKEYYENGQLKEEGVMTNVNHIYVGIWNYYSSTGKLDSAINFDKKYDVSYFKAIDIASKSDHKGNLADISLTTENGSTYWEISLPTGSNKKLRDALLINTKTGKVTIVKDKYSIVH